MLTSLRSLRVDSQIDSKLFAHFWGTFTYHCVKGMGIRNFKKSFLIVYVMKETPAQKFNFIDLRFGLAIIEIYH